MPKHQRTSVETTKEVQKLNPEQGEVDAVVAALDELIEKVSHPAIKNYLEEISWEIASLTIDAENLVDEEDDDDLDDDDLDDEDDDDLDDLDGDDDLDIDDEDDDEDDDEEEDDDVDD